MNEVVFLKAEKETILIIFTTIYNVHIDKRYLEYKLRHHDQLTSLYDLCKFSFRSAYFAMSIILDNRTPLRKKR